MVSKAARASRILIAPIFIGGALDYINRQPACRFHHHARGARQSEGPIRALYIWARVGSTEACHTFSHSDTHMAKVMRTPMKVAMSAAPLSASSIMTCKPGRKQHL